METMCFSIKQHLLPNNREETVKHRFLNQLITHHHAWQNIKFSDPLHALAGH
jgi:hypothetical protein